MRGLTPHAEKNRRDWNAACEGYERQHGVQLAAGAEPGWGVWQIPDSLVGVFADVDGKDVLELGCGGGHGLVKLDGEGARLAAVDVSERQLELARGRLDSAGVTAALVHASAESLPFEDASFDLVYSDHGALSFCEPELALPEAARVLRSGGELAFNGPTGWLGACWDPETKVVGERLVAGYFDRHRLEDEHSVEFRLPDGDWIRLFRSCRLSVEALIELRPPEGATTSYDYFVPYEWARRWPAERLWRLRKE